MESKSPYTPYCLLTHFLLSPIHEIYCNSFGIFSRYICLSHLAGTFTEGCPRVALQESNLCIALLLLLWRQLALSGLHQLQCLARALDMPLWHQETASESVPIR